MLQIWKYKSGLVWFALHSSPLCPVKLWRKEGKFLQIHFFVFLINVARDIYKTCKEEKRARNENDERKTFRISQTVALSSLCQQDPRNQGSENKTFFTPLESSRPSLSLRFMYQPHPWLVVISVLSNYIVDLKFSPVGNLCWNQ